MDINNPRVEREDAISHYFESFQPRAGVPRFSMLVFRAMLKVNMWFELSHSRHQLAELSDEELNDIGVTRSDADHEAHRHFYDN